MSEHERQWHLNMARHFGAIAVWHATDRYPFPQMRRNVHRTLTAERRAAAAVQFAIAAWQHAELAAA